MVKLKFHYKLLKFTNPLVKNEFTKAISVNNNKLLGPQSTGSSVTL